MRALMIGCTVALLSAGSWQAAHAQAAKDTKAAPPASDVRYFNSLGDLLGDLPVDAFIKETRQGRQGRLGVARRLLFGLDHLGSQGPFRH